MDPDTLIGYVPPCLTAWNRWGAWQGKEVEGENDAVKIRETDMVEVCLCHLVAKPKLIKGACDIKGGYNGRGKDSVLQGVLESLL